MLHNNNIFKAHIKRAVILIMAPFLFIACEKSQGSGLGSDQPFVGDPAGVDSLKLPVITYSRNVDSVLVALTYNEQVILAGGYRGNRLAGRYIDSYFGEAEASIVSQLVLSQVNADFGDNPVVDSVNLILRHTGFYGDTTEAMSFEVYELAEGLSDDSNFYSSYKPQLGNMLGELDGFLPRPNSVINYGGEELAPALKIPLDINYFQQNFADVGNGSFPDFSTNADFIEYFKGIVIKATDNSDGSILYFSLENAVSRIAIHFRNDTDTSSLNLTFSQSLSRAPIGFSIFNQDYSSSAFDLQNQNSQTGELTTYIQSMGGVTTVINIPDLDTIVGKGWVINRAFLELYTQRGTGSGLSPNSRVEPREMDESGMSIGSRIRDFVSGSGLGNGTIRLGQLRNNKYIFDISRYVFSVVNGDERKDLMIIPTSFSTTANRTILRGGSDPVEPAELIIYYTKP